MREAGGAVHIFTVGTVFGSEFNAHVRTNRGRNDGEFRRWLTTDAALEVLRPEGARANEAAVWLRAAAGQRQKLPAVLPYVWSNSE